MRGNSHVPFLEGRGAAMRRGYSTSSSVADFPFPLRPHTTMGQPADLPGPDGVLLYVPWFFDPAEPLFASPMRLESAAFGHVNDLGAPNYWISWRNIPARTCRNRRFA